MRILFLSATYLPTVNGVSYYQHHLAQALRNLGHKVYIFAPKHAHSSPDPFVIRYPAISTPIAPDYPVGLPTQHLKLLDHIPLDLVHVHHPFNIVRAAIALKRHRHLPFIFTHHTQYHQYLTTYLPIFPKFTQAQINRHLLNVGQQASLVICPTMAIYQNLASLGLKNLKHLPNGINLKPYQPLKSRQNKILRLIYIGRLEKEKNPQPLIYLAQVMSRTHHPFHLTLVGHGKQINALKTLTTRLKLDSYVTFTGQLSQIAIAQLLPQQHYFISYSHTEVMPLSYLEAMASGVPLLLTSQGEISGVTSTRNSLTLPSDFSDTAHLIIRHFHDASKYGQIVQQAIITAQRYSIEAQAPQLVACYQKALKLSPYDKG